MINQKDRMIYMYICYCVLMYVHVNLYDKAGELC